MPACNGEYAGATVSKLPADAANRHEREVEHELTPADLTTGLRAGGELVADERGSRAGCW